MLNFLTRQPLSHFRFEFAFHIVSDLPATSSLPYLRSGLCLEGRLNYISRTEGETESHTLLLKAGRPNQEFFFFSRVGYTGTNFIKVIVGGFGVRA